MAGNKYDISSSIVLSNPRIQELRGALSPKSASSQSSRENGVLGLILPPGNTSSSEARAMHGDVDNDAVPASGPKIDLNNSAISQTWPDPWEEQRRQGDQLSPPLSPPLDPWSHSGLIQHAYDIPTWIDEYRHVFLGPGDGVDNGFGDSPRACSPSTIFCTRYSDLFAFSDSVDTTGHAQEGQLAQELTVSALVAPSNNVDTTEHPQDDHPAQDVMDLIDERLSNKPQLLLAPFINRNTADSVQGNPEFAQAIAKRQSQFNPDEYAVPLRPTLDSHIANAEGRSKKVNCYAEGRIDKHQDDNVIWGQSFSSGESQDQDAADATWKSSPPQPNQQELQGLSSRSPGEHSQLSASSIVVNDPDQIYNEGFVAHRVNVMRSSSIVAGSNEFHRNNNSPTRKITNEEMIAAGKVYLQYMEEFGSPPSKEVFDAMNLPLTLEVVKWLDDRYKRMREEPPAIPPRSPTPPSGLRVVQPAELYYDPLDDDLNPEQEEREAARCLNVARNFTEFTPIPSLDWEELEQNIEWLDVCIFSITQEEFDAELEGFFFNNKGSPLRSENDINNSEELAMQDHIITSDTDMDNAPTQSAAKHPARLPAMQLASPATPNNTVGDAITSDLHLNAYGHLDNKFFLEETTNPDLELNVTSSESTSGNTQTSVQDAATYADVGLELSLDGKAVASPNLNPVLEKELCSASTETIIDANEDMSVDIDDLRPSKKARLEEMGNLESKLESTSTETIHNVSTANVNTVGSHSSKHTSFKKSKGFASRFQSTMMGTIHGTISSEKDQDVNIDSHLVEKAGVDSKLQGKSNKVTSDDPSKIFKFRIGTSPRHLSPAVSPKASEDDLDQAMELSTDDEVSLIQTSPIPSLSPITTPKPSKYKKPLKSTYVPSPLQKKSTKDVFAAVESRKAGASYMQAPTAGSSWSWGGASSRVRPILPAPFRILPAYPSSGTINLGFPASTQKPPIPAALPPSQLLRHSPYIGINPASRARTETPAQPPSVGTVGIGSPLSQGYDSKDITGQGSPVPDVSPWATNRGSGRRGGRDGRLRQMAFSPLHLGGVYRSKFDAPYANPNMTMPLGSSQFGGVSTLSRQLALSPGAEASPTSQHHSQQDFSPTPGSRKNMKDIHRHNLLVPNPSIPLPNPSGLPRKPPSQAQQRPNTQESSIGNTQVNLSSLQASPSKPASREIVRMFLTNQQSAQSAAQTLRGAVQKEGQPFTIEEDFDKEGAKVIVSGPAGSCIRGWIRKHVVFGRIKD